MKLHSVVSVAVLSILPILADAQSAPAAPAKTPAAAPAAAAPAAAAPAPAPAPVVEVADNRWSIWPMAGGVFSDASDLDHGWVVGLKATRPLYDHLAFSGGVDYTDLGTTNAKDYK